MLIHIYRIEHKIMLIFYWQGNDSTGNMQEQMMLNEAETGEFYEDFLIAVL